ncbi:DoxX family protein [Nonlabens arenilitoris]|uniref:DoxX family protein n=1 Tax=Nonlabens arenilitoris TaxID=1217969 RepID=A0A2S7UE80_9FLAO|nr:DoxX family protein [Nonlabens arenilitoris]PQJ32920.1 DoxX family protein [Nonlabens arenilitoris]
MKNKYLTYLLMRLIIGISMLGHGLVRIPKIEAFSNGMAAKFSESIIPAFMVEPFGYFLTIAEFLLGFLIIIGLFTRQALTGSIITMCLLVLGSTMIENWTVINSQLIHAAVFAFLLWNIDYNNNSVDHIIKSKN